MQESQVQSLGWENPLEKEMATHSSILAWRIPRTEEPGGYSPQGHKESNMTEQGTFSLHGLLDMEYENKSLYPLSLKNVGI